MSAALLALRHIDSTKAELTWAKRVVLRPRVPLALSMRIAQRRYGNGGTDISDGLSADLISLCRRSSVGVRVEVGKLPIAAQARAIAAKRGVSEWKLPFVMGGDFQFTVSSGRRNRSAMQKLGLHRIGVLVPSGYELVLPDGSSMPLPDIGHSDGHQLDFSAEVESLLSMFRRND